MKKKTLKVLDYLAWTVGIIAALVLLYGIIVSLI